jgi:hypothetical protein
LSFLLLLVFFFCFSFSYLFIYVCNCCRLPGRWRVWIMEVSGAQGGFSRGGREVEESNGGQNGNPKRWENEVRVCWPHSCIHHQLPINVVFLFLLFSGPSNAPRSTHTQHTDRATPREIRYSRIDL